MKLVIATGNQGKLKEFKEALKGLPFDILSSDEAGVSNYPEETGNSYEANATLKAGHALTQSGFASLADDSGLEVTALDGAPGLYSARYGNKPTDIDRLEYLLENMADVQDRSARFVCSLVLALPSGETKAFWGESKGEILKEAVGDDGFGYDPVFYSHDLKTSFAEASKEQKEFVSHRGRAIEQLKEWLESNPLG